MSREGKFIRSKFICGMKDAEVCLYTISERSNENIKLLDGERLFV